MGLGFLIEATYLLPLTVGSLLLAGGALGYRANRRRGYAPFVLGITASIGLMVGKFVVDSDVAVYGSIAVLMGASLWNSWPKKRIPDAPSETLIQLGSINKEN